MIDWNPVIQPKFVEQPLLQPALLSHHPPGPPTDLMVNYIIPGQTALLDEFFNGILADCVESRIEWIPALHVMQ